MNNKDLQKIYYTIKKINSLPRYIVDMLDIDNELFFKITNRLKEYYNKNIPLNDLNLLKFIINLKFKNHLYTNKYYIFDNNDLYNYFKNININIIDL